MNILHGRYEVIKKLGSGGMSQVFLCTDNHIGKCWAIKRIPFTNNNSGLIKGEVEMLKALDFYMFPRITDAFIKGSDCYIVTDYIEGKSLESVGAIPEETVIRYINDLANALLFLHCQSPPILYLDLKPQNIMVKPDGKIMLIDFGIAQSVIEGSKSLGTAGYAAPEQYGVGTQLTSKSDVFALGMTIYSMLTGEAPLKEYDLQIKRIRESSNISKRMKRLILKCTALDSTDRYDVKDVKAVINKTISRRRGFLAGGAVLLAAIITFCSATALAADKEIQKEKNSAASELAKKVSECIENGEYTRDGIRIICGYLDGNFLDEQTKLYYTYVVARNLFLVQRDYLSAKQYFERLPIEMYPEAEYFKKLCIYMTSFTYDSDEFINCLNEFSAYNSSLSEGDQKKQNEDLISFLIESDKLKGRKNAKDL